MSETAVVVSEPGSTGDAVVEALAGTEGILTERADPTAGDCRIGDDADSVFAVGETALLALADCPLDCPVFPIGVGADRYDVPVRNVDVAAEAFLRGTYETVSHPILDVAVDGEAAGTAITDVTLLTSEPARISEYAVGSPDGWLDTVRSDGVVIATPLGSAGYARDAGGSLLAPETGLITVPISPYAMHADSWVLRPPVSLSVERDEAAVSLLLDDESVRSVPADTPIDVSIGREISLVRPQTLGDG
ncbi:NAD(+)/NADH kinase [Halobellus inordinatus]|uniref:NAD(+)/NADH kinase n=1 Tax=Halobellus inordinatus TaxID=1126236 RepID=UPI002113CB6C|nr:NAD(+)/NADH kinase [Halobellus ramosii]